jgi:HEPN domain-containing protein
MRLILEHKTVLLQISRERFVDARVLLKQKRYNGAVYLGGYIIECLLKAAICVQLRRDTLPGEYRTHELGRLLRSSGLMQDLRSDAILLVRYSTVEEWNVEIRYRGAQCNVQEATKFLDAVKEVQQWILNKLAI